MKVDSKKIYLLVLFWFAVWFLIVGQYRGFNDAFEVICGGWFIKRGLLPYRDFFFHKMPLMFYLSFFVHLLQLKKIFWFRVFLLLFYCVNWYFLLNQVGNAFKKSILLFLLILPFLGSIFYFDMWLVGNPASLAIFSIYFVMFSAQDKKKFVLTKRQVIYLSIMFFIAFNSSLSSMFALFPLFVYLLVKNFNNFKSFAVLSFFLNLLFPIYFLTIGVVRDFFWANFIFPKFYFKYRLAEPDELKYGNLGIFYRILKHNFLYYIEKINILTAGIKNFIYSSKFINPIFFLIKNSRFVPIDYFRYIWLVYSELIKNFDFQMVIFLTYFIFLIVLLFRKKVGWMTATIFFIIGLRARSNELFHLFPYYILGLGILSYLFVDFCKRRVVLGGVITAFFLLVVLNFSVKEYAGFLRDKSPIIKQETIEISKKIKSITYANDKIWCPGASNLTYFLAKRNPGVAYYFYFPVLHKVEKIRNDVKRDLVNREPKIIFFNAQFANDLLVLIEKGYNKKDNLYLKEE